MTRFLAFGDLHLGQGSGLGDERLAEQAAVLEAIADAAVERRVDGILFGGDAFEGPTILPEQLDVFAHFVSVCNDVGIPIVAITGNGRHDAAMRSTNGLHIFNYMPGITVSARPTIHDVAGVHVVTLPWVHPGRFVALHNGDVSRDEINAAAARMLVEVARDLRQSLPSEARTVLLLHWSVEGASLPNGLRIDDHAHEPILPVADLEELDFDAVVCSHIHKPQRFEILMGGPFFYTGSPMPLNFGEANVEHGVWIVDFDDVDVTAELIPIESRRFVTHDLDLTTDEGIFALANLPDVSGAFVKVRYRATEEQARHFDHAEWRRTLEDAGAHKVWIHAEVQREQRARAEGLDEGVDDVQAFELWCDANFAEIPDARRAKLRDRHHRYLQEAVA